MTKEALKLALEALKELVAQTEGRLFAVKHDHFALQNAREAITACEQALAEPVQEPVAWVEYETGNNTKRPQNCGTGYCSCIECVMKPEQEPVAWMDVDEKGAISGLRYWSEPDNRHEVALYTTSPQQQWVGLSEKERNDIEDYCEMMIGKPAFDTIEAKLKEKNSAP